MAHNVSAVFLDRDGIMCELHPDPVTGELEGPLRVVDVALVRGATEAMTRLRDAGFLLIGITNQPAAAKGFITLDEQELIHQKVLKLLADDGLVLDDWRICPHHPDATIKELRCNCTCRKPLPGMLLDAAAAHHVDCVSSWMVGDSDSDIAAGTSAKTKTILVGPVNNHKRQHPELATLHRENFTSAANAILNVTR